MERLACVLVPALPLQMLGLRDPTFRTEPAAWVDDLRPQGVVLATNRAARAAGVLPGMRHSAALALHGGLRAGAVTAQEVVATVALLTALLRQFSPRVEPCDPEQEAGVFWLDADGLDGLFGSLEQWAQLLRAHLQQQGWRATVVVGAQRFATYAIGRQFGGVRVCSPQQEPQWLARVALSTLGPLLGLAPETRDALELLGVRTVTQFLALPAAAVRERHGEQAFEVHRRASGALCEPLRPVLPSPVPEAWHDLEPPDDQTDRLLFVARGLLVGLTREVALRREAVAAVRLRLDLEPTRTDQPTGEREVVAVLQPAEPTLDEPTLVDLVRLRLERTELPAKVTRLSVALQPVVANAAQLRLWQLNGRRDLDAATRALARLRAAFGPGVVVRAELRRGHLPEARFGWLPLHEVMPARSSAPPVGTVFVRRTWRPQALPARPRHEPDGWLLRNWRQGRVVRAWGPFRLTGGWWVREVRRDYHWLETETGDWLWVFWDQVRRQWFVQAEVD